MREHSIHRRRYTLLHTLLAILLSLNLAYAQIERRTVAPDPIKQYSDQVLIGIDLIYNLEFAKAEKIFGEIRNKDPKSPVGYFFLGNDAMVENYARYG